MLYYRVGYLFVYTVDLQQACMSSRKHPVTAHTALTMSKILPFQLLNTTDLAS
jgi:hypothetical protein